MLRAAIRGEGLASPVLFVSKLSRNEHKGENEPGTTEGRVEHYRVVVEVRVDVAASSETCDWLTKVGNVRITILNALGDVAAWEEPNLDGIAGPLHGIDASVDTVEAGAGRVRGVVLNAATVSLANLRAHQ